ncbi:MAG: PilZ domain-containing protein [Acidobacteriota bacterium]
MSQDTSRDRRIDTRIDRINLVQVSRFDEEGFRADLATGRTINISRGGLRLELHHPLPLRSQIRLDLAVGDEIVHVEGTVAYLEAIDEERCHMGISFDEVAPEVQSLLDQIVTENA